MKDRVCSHCGNAFPGQRQQRWCSLLCMLEGRAERRGDCWIWHPTPGESRFQCTWRGKHWGMMYLLAELTGTTLFGRNVLAPRCGHQRCVNPHHFAVAPAGAPNPNGEKGRLTDEQVLAIAASTEGVRIVADQYGCAVNTVRAIKSGRIHSALTGISKPEKHR